MSTANQDNDGIKIGYMPLAHDSYWKFFPEHLPNALHWAKVYKDFLSQFGTIHETGKLIDCPERSEEARHHFQAMDVDMLVMATVTYSTPDDIVLDLKRFPRPAIAWNTQPSPSIPPDLDFGKWMMEHGVTGVTGLTNVLRREIIPYSLILEENLVKIAAMSCFRVSLG